MKFKMKEKIDRKMRSTFVQNLSEKGQRYIEGPYKGLDVVVACEMEFNWLMGVK